MCFSVELAIPERFSALCNQCKQRLEGTDKNFQLRERLWHGLSSMWQWHGAKCDL